MVWEQSIWGESKGYHVIINALGNKIVFGKKYMASIYWQERPASK